jgi:hypothetical protein
MLLVNRLKAAKYITLPSMRSWVVEKFIEAS